MKSMKVLDDAAMLILKMVQTTLVYEYLSRSYTQWNLNLWLKIFIFLVYTQVAAQ
jgi:hypothetical protein